MKTIYIDKIQRIIKNKKRLQELLKIKLTNRGREVTIDGSPEDEYIAEKVLEALNFGFPFSTAISLKDNIFEVINIKDHTKRQDLQRIRARIIGTGGKTLKTLSDLTGCSFEIKDNNIGILGPAENIEQGQNALISIIKGAKQAHVYGLLEKNRPERIEDLGLKKKDKNL
jgi:ribosomal RNA assembly protein